MGRHEPGLDQRSQPVDLANAAPFALGTLGIEPATLQVRDGAAGVTLQPRVMKVLVALHDCAGEVVSRDELVLRCWDRRIVGDDAIQKIIAKVRALASAHPGSFAIETIPKVGYRLVAATPDAGREALSTAPVDRRGLFGLALGGLAIAGGAGAWLLRGATTPAARREASALVDKGREAEAVGLPAAMALAENYYKLATEADPGFAEAWGALARNLVAAELVSGARRPDNALRRIDSAVARARTLEPANRDAELATALAAPYLRAWDAYGARLDALAGRNDDVLLPLARAFFQMNVGQWDRAIELLDELETRQPLTPSASLYRVYAHYGSGRFEEAESESRKALERFPQLDAAWGFRLGLLTLTGEHRAARAFLDAPGTPASARRLLEARRPLVEAMADGDGPRVRATVAELVANPDRRLDRVPDLVPLALAADDPGTARNLVEAYFRDAGPYREGAAPLPPRTRAQTAFLFEPTVAPMLGDPAIGRVLDWTGLPAYWRRNGLVPPRALRG